jgi:hypothetical protein
MKTQAPTLAKGRGRRRSARGTLGACGAGLVLAAALFSGCTSPRNVLGTTASPCYRAVAVARLALHREGRFFGVRPLRGTGLTPALALYRSSSLHLAYGPRTPLCLVAYRGRFDASVLTLALRPGPRKGRLAVVIVRQRDERVVGTLLFAHAPPRRLARLLPAH